MARCHLGAIALGLLTLAACDSGKPHSFHGVRGALDDGDYYCAIYPADGYAGIQFGDSYYLTINLPAQPDVWDREGASLEWGPDILCPYGLGLSGARVQYGSESVPDGDCDTCSGRYHALYVEGLAFPGGEACDCLGECRTFGANTAERYYVWCEAPDEFGQ